LRETDLYESPNGDRWSLRTGDSRKLVVCHRANAASGGKVSEIDAEVFLAHGGTGPEYRALINALARLPSTHAGDMAATITQAMAERLSKALGEAVSRCWSELPQEIQHDLFEAAVAAEGEAVRQALAVYLHDQHARTREHMQNRAAPEPDSLGG
jgi:hypothetical protein